MNTWNITAVIIWAAAAAIAAPSSQTAQAPVEEGTPLAAERRRVAGLIGDLAAKRQAAADSISRLQKDSATLREALATPGMEDYVGPLLNERRRQLPDPSDLNRSLRAVQHEANEVHILYLRLGDEVDALAGTDPRIGEMEALRAEYKRYFSDLASFNVLEKQLLGETRAMLRLIEEHMLWLPSTPPIYKARFPARLEPEPGTWRLLGSHLRRDMIAQPAGYVAAVLLLVAWLAVRRMAGTAHRRIRELVSHPYTDSFKLTVGALGLAFYHALPVPALLWFLANRLAASAPATAHAAYEFAAALACGLERAAFFLFLVMFLRRLCRKGGLAEAHFQWGDSTVMHLRTNLGWLGCVGVPLVFIFNFAEQHPDAAWRESIARIGGILGVLALGLFLGRMCDPRSRLNDGIDQHPPPGRPRRSGWFRYYLALGVPLVLAIMGTTRYSHTAVELGRHLYRTLALALGMIIAHSLIVRFVLVSRQRLAIREAMRSRAESSGPVEEVSAGEGLQSTPGSAPSVEEIGHHIRMLLRWLLGVGSAVGVWVLWRDIIPAFSFVERTRLWTYGGEGGAAPSIVYLSDLLIAIVAAWTTAVLAKNGPDVLDTVLLSRLKLDAAARFAAATVSRYAIVIVGLAVSLSSIGLGWSRISWLAAAITVGLGFGLQEIFANFVSGLIILFERPVRIGDIVTVGGVDGKITRICIDTSS